MLAYFRAPLSWLELGKRTVARAVSDDCFGLAAQLAFYFFLAAFPALLFLVSLLAYLPVDSALDNALERLQPVIPNDVMDLMRGQLDALLGEGRPGLMTIAVGGALWSSSTAVAAVISALNRAYDIQEWRPWWHTRLLAIGLTVASAGFVLGSFVLVVAGDQLATFLAGQVGAGQVFVSLWSLGQYVVAFGLAVFAVDLIYHFAPNAEAEWAWLTPGALLAVTLWGVASFGFRLYVQTMDSYAAVYGAIGSVIVMLLWLYISGLALLLGAELNAEIERAMPSRDDGPQSPWRRKKIGIAAEKASGLSLP